MQKTKTKLNKEQLLLRANENPKFYKNWTLQQVERLINFRKKAVGVGSKQNAQA